jgi:hypothetical protein
MGKSKQSKWFDDSYEDEHSRLNIWEQRRAAKRIAWEQKNVTIDESAETDTRTSRRDYD